MKQTIGRSDQEEPHATGGIFHYKKDLKAIGKKNPEDMKILFI